MSFDFDNAPPVCISIETRPEVGEGFAPIASLFKQFELIYVVGDERDLVRVRTNYRNEEVYLYRIQTPPEGARSLFLVYLERINELADRPEFYHLLKNSCTINIVRYANAAGRTGRFDSAISSTAGSIAIFTPPAGWTLHCPSQSCASVPGSTMRRGRPTTPRISPGVFVKRYRGCT